jgi:tRNA threonylcarbamoyladenosine biosynthesis protein TsaE
MKSFISNSVENTIDLGAKIGALLNPGDVILLTGDLGAGKTHIAKGVGKALGVKRIINSPTFTIVKEYSGNNVKFYHLDLYRLDGLNNDFDLEEYIESDGICVIEWPHQIEEILPKEYLNIKLLRLDDNQRKIEIEGIGRYKKYEEMI